MLTWAIWAIWPSFQYQRLTNSEKESLREEGKLEQLESRIIKQGLDLKGGMYIVLEVDLPTLMENLAINKDVKLNEFRPSNYVMGIASINGRRVMVGGDDFTVRGGAADGNVGDKKTHQERMALELRIPIIRLVDGTGGGGSVKTIEDIGRTYLPGGPGFWETANEAMAKVPVIAAAMGSVAGIGAARVAISHFSVIVKGTGQVFTAGPPVVERGLGMWVEKEELGGAEIHALVRQGTIRENDQDIQGFIELILL